MQRRPELYEQILRLRAIRDYSQQPLEESDLAAILEAGRWTGTSKNRQDWAVVVVRDAGQRDLLVGCGDFTEPIRRAPVSLVLVQEGKQYEFDIGRVAQNMMLAAAALGVGSCPVTLHRSAQARQVLGVPEGKTTRYAIALGYPGEKARPAQLGGRKPVTSFIHDERYRQESDEVD
ncbi:MAG TPA: nitroreductase family protein [Acidimicrobiia bacterium]|nr:nitroreductase family protein [Acidimicrobiia bacterium]